MENKISCVLPVCNASVNLAETIRSLQEQLYPYHELIIIDDGSTDCTAEILQHFSSRDEKIKVITHASRAGAAVSRNEGNLACEGNIIAVCDCDYYFKERLEAINEFFKFYEGTNKGIFYSNSKLKSAKNMFKVAEQQLSIWDFKSKCTIMHPTVAYRTELCLAHPYHERSIETDLFEFMLLDMHKAGVEAGATDTALLLKTEGEQVRDKAKANKLKAKLYKEYGIKGVKLLDKYMEIR